MTEIESLLERESRQTNDGDVMMRDEIGRRKQFNRDTPAVCLGGGDGIPQSGAGTAEKKV